MSRGSRVGGDGGRWKEEKKQEGPWVILPRIAAFSAAWADRNSAVRQAIFSFFIFLHRYKMIIRKSWW